jgi:hypothetical protein
VNQAEAILHHAPGLENALARAGDTHTFGDVLQMALAGDVQLWIEDEAMLVTEVRVTPRRRTLHFWLGTGKKDAVVALSEAVSKWGRESAQCTHATLTGRRGWQRVLASADWRPSDMVLLEKEL